MKYLFYLFVFALSLSSCKVPAVVSNGTTLIAEENKSDLTHDQRAARRKLRKALLKDPNLIKRIKVDTTIHGIATGPVDVVAPGFTTEVGLNCDSLNKVLKALKASAIASGNSDPSPGIYLYQDSLVRMKVMLDSMGNMYTSFEVLPRIIHDTVSLPWDAKITMTGIGVPIFEHDNWYNHWQSWLLIAISILMTYLWVSQRRKNSVEINLKDAGHNTGSSTGGSS